MPQIKAREKNRIINIITAKIHSIGVVGINSLLNQLFCPPAYLRALVFQKKTLKTLTLIVFSGLKEGCPEYYQLLADRPENKILYLMKT